MNIVECSKDVLCAQQEALFELFKPFLKNKKVLFCDVPVHGNVGDSLIYLGTLELFNRLNVKVIDSISAYEPERLKTMSVTDDVVLVCQGGGNFGDLYSLHQDFRHLLLDVFPNNQILLMPQSIHYDDLDIFKRDCSKYKESLNYHIFLRDEFSFESIKSIGVANVVLCPDIATLLFGKFKVRKKGNNKKLLLLRHDIESNNNNNNGVDWVNIVSPALNNSLRLSSFLIRKNNRMKIPYLTHFLVKIHHRALANQADKYFSEYDVIQTDRLHGMIFSQLLQMRCEALDNSYGKLRRYIQRWYR